MRMFFRLSLAICMTVFSLYFAALQAHMLQPFQNRISYLYEYEGSRPEAKEIYKEQERLSQRNVKGLSAIWWKEKPKSYIINPDIGGADLVPIVAACGRTDLLFPKSRVLDYDQTELCLLGSRTAANLFGTSEAPDIEGLQVTYEGHSYKVAGTIYGRKDGFLYEAGKDEGLVFERMTIQCQNPDRKAIIRHKVESYYTPDTLMDYDLCLFLIQMALLIIPAGVSFCFLRMLRRFAKDYSAYLPERCFWWGVYLAVAVAALYLASHIITVPVDFIPSKWSDFQFWAELWEEKRGTMELFLTEGLTIYDLSFFIPFFKVLLYVGFGMLWFIYGVKTWAKRRRY